MRRFLLTSTVFLILLSAANRSEAVIVECANCASLFQQLQDAATQAKQLATQALQYKTQLDQYTNQIINTTALPMSVWSQVQSDIGQVRNLANAASLLTGNSGSIMARLQNAQGYANQATFLPQNIEWQFQNWQQTLGQANNSLGRVLATQQQQQIGYAAQQQQIALQSQTAHGQLAAIQATNETLGLVSTQMNQMQATITAMAQEQATRDLVTADRDASEDAAMQRLLQPAVIPVNGYKSY